MLITKTGVEGGPIYALSAMLRERIAAHGEAVIQLDLTPDLSEDELLARLSRPRGSTLDLQPPQAHGGYPRESRPACCGSSSASR